MNPEESKSELGIEYQKLLKVLGHTAKYLEGLDIDPSVLKSYRQLVRFLRARPPEAINEILRGTGASHRKSEKEVQTGLSESEIQAMTIEQILDMASNPEASRRHLEQIASVRFGVTKGGLSALRSRQALGEKIRTLVSNESTHGSITRAAEQHGTG
jgi:hypothetical protein